MELTIEKLDTWFPVKERPFIISGPCSAETEEQLLDTCTQLYQEGIRVMRAGVWKPRTRPGGFEGIGKEALGWINNVKRELDVKFAVEVGNPEHVEACLEAGIDILWVGARSTVNPFTVQEIADSLRGVDVPVLVKNPINPDLALWLGAIERINKAGITKIGAIHRGFSSFQKTKYRNVPAWQFPIELKRKFPDMPLIGDPSHICGNREMLLDVSQKAFDLDYDGLMIESHRDPDNAWSDAKQQITPAVLGNMIKQLKPKSAHSADASFNHFMDEIRDQIDNADREILEAIANRMRLVERIGEYKRDNNVTIFQVDRWNEIIRSRAEWGNLLSLESDFIEELYKLVHVASIKRQTEIMTSIPAGSKE